MLSRSHLRRAVFRVASLSAIVAGSACVAPVAASHAYSLASSCHALSAENQWCLVNGAHNWTKAEDVNWGSSDGSGGGYSARLGLAMWNNAITVDLGHVFSSSYYTPKRSGEPGGFFWNFGSQFAGSYPIREGVTQINVEGAQQWVWGWAYGP